MKKALSIAVIFTWASVANAQDEPAGMSGLFPFPDTVISSGPAEFQVVCRQFSEDEYRFRQYAEGTHNNRPEMLMPSNPLIKECSLSACNDQDDCVSVIKETSILPDPGQ